MENGQKYEVGMKKSVMVSGMNFATEFLNNLYKEVVKIGGNEEQIFTALKTGSKAIPEIAKLIVGVAKEVLQSLSDLIILLKLDYVNLNITESNFPAQPEDAEKNKEYKVFHFGRSTSSEDVIKEMDKENYRPATLRELLRWANNNWNGSDWVVALGQICLDAVGNRHVVVLDLDDGRRRLDLDWFGHDWNDSFRFLAVRK